MHVYIFCISCSPLLLSLGCLRRHAPFHCIRCGEASVLLPQTVVCFHLTMNKLSLNCGVAIKCGKWLVAKFIEIQFMSSSKTINVCFWPTCLNATRTKLLGPNKMSNSVFFKWITIWSRWWLAFRRGNGWNMVELLLKKFSPSVFRTQPVWDPENSQHACASIISIFAANLGCERLISLDFSDLIPNF